MERRKAEEEAETIHTRTGSADALILFGPLVPASWLVHHTRRDALRKFGKEVPDPVAGCLLIDTGATRSSIDDDVALDLGADMVGRRESFGVGGHVMRRVVLATMHIPLPDGSGLIHSGEITSVVGLRRVWEANRPILNGKPCDIVGLLGRDILRHASFSYDGHTGETTLRIRRQGMQRVEKDKFF